MVAVRGPSSKRSFPASRGPGQGITAPSAVAKGGVLFITALAPEGVGKGDVAAQARAIVWGLPMMVFALISAITQR